MVGLEKMINVRRGFPSFEHNGVLLRVLAW
jgi:hypothetical protein